MNEEELRYQMETKKQKTILLRNRVYTVISIIVGLILCVMLGWGLWSWKEANNMSGTFNARANSLLEKLEAKLDRTDTIQEDVHEVLLSIKGDADELKLFIADTRRETANTLQSLQRPVQTLDGVLVAGRGVLEEGRAQLKQNGDATAKTVLNLDSLLAANSPKITEGVNNFVSATAHFDHSMAGIDTMLSDGKVQAFIDDALVRGQKILVSVETATGNVAVMTEDGKTITAQGARVAKDVADFVHGYTNPGAQPWYRRFILTPLKAVLGYGLTVYQITKK